LFDVRVDGVLAEELGLAGKPDPAMLVEAASRLTVRPDRCVVIEDAEAGVTAGRDGGFALVICVSRSGNADDLLRCGADVVVADAADISVRMDDQASTPDARTNGDRLGA
jgi:beta-phosphoglucomutase-like phosphatase (HAD superfamily)